MMTTADIIIDEEGRPILVVPAKLSDGSTVLTVQDKSFQISVNGTTELELSDVKDEYLIALGGHKKVGISVQEEGQPMPDTIHYVADVEQKFSA